MVFEGRKQFFFEKKNQKTSAPLRAELETPVPPVAKKFLRSFFQKATAYFL
jgi:hypothetical protein